MSKDIKNNEDIKQRIEASDKRMREAARLEKKKRKERNVESRTIHLKKSDGTASLYEWVHSLVFAVAIVVVLLTFFIRLVDVSGNSMVPTLLDHNKVIVTDFFYTPKTGDIVVVSHGKKYEKPIIKRVIATEGQTLSIQRNNVVIVDGKILDESGYAKGDTLIDNPQLAEGITIPKGKVFVMGDNREQSMDSRSENIDLIDVNDIIGKAEFVVFPFEDAKYLY